MKKHQNHYDYETKLELAEAELKHYLNAVHYYYKQKTDIYQAILGRGWIVGYIIEFILYGIILGCIFYAGYGLSSYQQKDKSIDMTVFVEKCIDVLPNTGSK